MAEEKSKNECAAEESWSAAFARVCRGILGEFAAPFEFLGGVVMVLPQIFKPRGVRRRELHYYLDLCGVRSLVIVIMISVLMGAVLAIQSALPARPIATIATISGPNSLSTAKPTRSITKISVPNLRSCSADWIANTAPISTEIMITITSERTPQRSR